MFFGKYSKLKNELQNKNEQNNTLQLVIEELNKESKEQLHTSKKELRVINKELEKAQKTLNKSNDELKIKTKKIKSLNEQLETMTNEDILTGAYNKRYFYDIAENIISLSKREKKSLSIAVIYIDKYYDIKNNNGDGTINKLVQLFIQNMSGSIRESDVFVRFDDDEFVILFPNTTLDQAMVVSKKIENSIESSGMVGSVKLKINIGISEFLYSQENINVTLNRAKKALHSSVEMKQGNIAKSA